MKTLWKTLFPPSTGTSAWVTRRPCQEVCGDNHACDVRGEHSYQHVCACGFRWAA